MAETPSPRPAREAPLPEHIALTHDGANLVLDIRWFRWYHVAMLLFAIFWDGFLVFWYSRVLASPSAPSMAFWFPMLHVGVGIGLTYYVIAGFVNRTRVTVGGGAVDVRIGPLPWLGSKRVEASDIAQVFGEEIRSNTRSGVSYTYRVNAVTPQNRKLILVSGLSDRDVALYLEQEIEKALGITDEKVPGELEK